MPIPSPVRLALAGALLVLPGALHAQAVDSTRLAGTRTYTPRSIEQQMTPEERRATGVMRLSARERRALAAWAARRVAAASAATRDSLAGAPSAGYEASAAAAAAAAGDLASAPPGTFALREVREGGRFVVLSDGALWEVAPEDRPTAAAWAADAVVSLDPIDAPTGDWGTAIREARSARAVAARFAGRAP